MELLDHQVRTAKTVLQRFRGALLCDEVGMGKTIEAGLIIADPPPRPDRSTLMVPPSLIEQWKGEMRASSRST